ncbi:hypothetical protein GCK72_007158 [Caenorhabditis remanei]|uniref:Uncharacterized protein n=1 Tax=Caenorhabditis remanei TaxID=31234 RepID=E3MV77_CAERE|nr:hypothetical protein GCK72_007158 [Caenorhabditis remanei]EFP10151.1 hypothetical protein CRE_24632 [Caenorhabditis remanei]KAF1767199.1 hypothetical protein GCK72_007158 [Caenorhabditis remanei]
MFSFSKIVSFVFLALFLSSGSVSAGLIRVRRQSYWNSNGVVNNVVTDNMAGGPTSLGWAQVPHVYSPMFSPVFGK